MNARTRLGSVVVGLGLVGLLLGSAAIVTAQLPALPGDDESGCVFSVVATLGPVNEIQDNIVAAEPAIKEVACRGGSSSSCHESSKGVVIGVVYKHIDYGLPCLRLLGGSCAGTSEDHAWELRGMPNGWNDVVSSAEVSDPGIDLGCGTIHLYEHNDFNGVSQPCSPDCNYVGSAFNDKTSSLKIYA